MSSIKNLMRTVWGPASLRLSTIDLHSTLSKNYNNLTYHIYCI